MGIPILILVSSWDGHRLEVNFRRTPPKAAACVPLNRSPRAPFMRPYQLIFFDLFTNVYDVDERKTLEKMITIYCRKNHGTKGELCGECSALLDYASERLDKCPLKPNKPVCSQCKIHCYRAEKREHIKIVMRFSGPRMMYKDPAGALEHLLRKIRR